LFFVNDAIGYVLKTGCIIHVPSNSLVVNHLAVSVNTSGKQPRLILDLTVLIKYV